MGGIGSGRDRGWGRLFTTDDVPRCDVRSVARTRWIKPSTALALRDHAGRPQWIALEWTQCGYGGTRPWARCPGCGRRVGVLYRLHGAWRCRVCHDLAYASTRLPDAARLVRQAGALRAQFGLRTNVLEPLTWFDKPPRMWDRTFARILARAERLEGLMRMAVLASLMACTASLAGLAACLPAIEARSPDGSVGDDHARPY